MEEYLAIHGRPEAYEALHPQEGAYYDSMITIDLSKVEPMAALPFHPAEAYPIRELMANPGDIFREVEKRAAEQFGGKVNLSLTDKLVDGKVVVDQGIIAGCAGGCTTTSLRPPPFWTATTWAAATSPCPSIPLRAGEPGAHPERGTAVPAPGGGSLQALLLRPLFRRRGRTRQQRPVHPPHHPELPQSGGLQARRWPAVRVVLMDARSIAATARNHGVLTPATEADYVPPKQGKRTFDTQVYDRRVYFGFGHPQPEAALKFGPNIAEWPPIPALADNLLMQVASVLRDPVTTTDELIPPGRPPPTGPTP